MKRLPERRTMKLAIWAKSPSPQQSDFYEALRQFGVDLRVLYLERLRDARLALGWQQPKVLSRGETILGPRGDPFQFLQDWRERLHVVPGYSRPAYRQAARDLSRAGVPWVHWSESSRPVWRSYISWPVKRWYARLVNRSALGAFAQGDMATRDFVRWGVRREKIAHLFYAVRGISSGTQPDPVTSDFAADRTAFVFVGSFCQRKACDVLIDAFARLGPKLSRTALVFVGDGPQAARYRRQADAIGLHDHVLFRGVVPVNAVGAVLAACDVLVLPSRFDGWGVVVNEAASAGLALIATEKVGSAYHLIEPGLNGFQVQAGSAASLTAAMRRYAHDAELAAVHGARSRLLFGRFTPAHNVERFVTTVRGWLADRPEWSRFHAVWAADPTVDRIVSAAA
jgi:glycosyltransferase involved in cell wall biosynthesis